MRRERGRVEYLVFAAATTSLALLAAGCTWAEPKQQSVSTLQRTPTDQFDVAPKQMLQLVKQAVTSPPLSTDVESEHDGIVTTGWKSYRGELHIVRYWYERTKFQIVVTPDFDEPLRKCRVQVFDETQERATERQPWYPANNTQRPERAMQVLDAVRQRAASESK